MNRSIFGLAAAVALISGSDAAVLVDNFESYSPVNGDMNSQGGWVVANGSGPEGAVVIIDSYTWDGSSRSATVGGVAQTTLGLTSLSHSVFGVTLGSSFSAPTTVKWEMSYTESTEGPRNPFQFTLGSSAGNLLTIDLAAAGTNQYTLSWGSGLSPSDTPGPVGILVAGQSTQIQLDTWWNGTNVEYKLSNAGSSVSTGVFGSALSSSEIQSFAVNWNSTGGAGNGSITVDNVSVVPEPSSALLGLLGATFAFTRRRRA